MVHWSVLANRCVLMHGVFVQAFWRLGKDLVKTWVVCVRVEQYEVTLLLFGLGFTPLAELLCQGGLGAAFHIIHGDTSFCITVEQFLNW